MEGDKWLDFGLSLGESIKDKQIEAALREKGRKSNFSLIKRFYSPVFRKIAFLIFRDEIENQQHWSRSAFISVENGP